MKPTLAVALGLMVWSMAVSPIGAQDRTAIEMAMNGLAGEWAAFPETRTSTAGTRIEVGAAALQFTASGSILRGVLTTSVRYMYTDRAPLLVELSVPTSLDFSGPSPVFSATGGVWTGNGASMPGIVTARNFEFDGQQIRATVYFGQGGSLELLLRRASPTRAGDYQRSGDMLPQFMGTPAHFTFDKAMDLEKEGRRDEAITVLSRLTTDFPNSPAELLSYTWLHIGRLTLAGAPGGVTAQKAAFAAQAFERALGIGGLRADAAASARQMSASAQQLERSANTAPRAVPSPVRQVPQVADARSSTSPRTPHRQTVSASAIESAMWRPLTFVCGATYEVTFLDNEARDWTFWRLGRRAANLASSDTPFETAVWSGVPRVGTRISIPSSLCPGGNGNVTLDSYASWSRTGYGRVAVLDEVDTPKEQTSAANGALAPFVGVWTCVPDGKPATEYNLLTVRPSGQAVWIEWEETAAPVRVTGQSIHIDMLTLTANAPDPRLRHVFDLSLVGRGELRGSLVQHDLIGVGSSARPVQFNSQLQCRRP